MALSLGASSLRAQSAAPDPCATTPQNFPTYISTTGTAQTRIPNTAVDITLGLTVMKVGLPATQRALAAQSGTLLTFLRAQGAQRLITTNVSFTPETRYQKHSLDKTVGYTGTTSVSFRTTPEKAPDLLAGALANGANTIDGTVFTPTEQEIEDARRDLAAQATKTAVAQVETIARAVGLHVLSMRDISVGSASPGTPDIPSPAMVAMPAMMRAGEPPPPPIATAQGDQQLSISVSVTAAAGR
ncbi:SIMPL domain-containing protein [Terriglobus sp.]|uniref:SIMPL domain-containing protein n=1 Tax=Terriglobus sp. TaxID=1889013 RepID=UPI003AFF7EA8